MTILQLVEWMAFDSIEPIGDDRIDLAAGIIASTVANGTGKKKNGKAFTPQDFMPLRHEEPESVDGDELAEKIKAAFKQMKGAPNG